jgi:hypothetical protein
MSAEQLRGVWTYRSFFNVPDGREPPSGIQVWKAELYLEVDPANHRIFGHLGERRDPTPETDPAHADKPYPFLNVEGVYTDGDPVRIRWRAIGREDSAWETWVYDYQGVLSPAWQPAPQFDATVPETPTILGTVVRTVAHDGAPAGQVFSFHAVKHEFKEPRIATPLPEAVVAMLASPTMRLHHQLWHASRDKWSDLKDEQKDWLRQHKWQPGTLNSERPAGLDKENLTNHSGEDFLFMHRRMIKAVKDIGGAEERSLQGWSQLPGQRSLADFQKNRKRSQIGNIDGNAVPDAWIVTGKTGTSTWLATLRTPSTYDSRFRAWERQYTDPAWLSTVTLGELGARIEFTIHNWMHMRWSSVQRDQTRNNAAVPEGRVDDDFSEKWFAPWNDHLGATFSSHINPIFWRLHGWVDSRIEDWFRAQESVRPGIVKRRMVGGIEWFEVDGRWVNVAEPWEGPVGDGHHHDGHDAHSGLDLDPEVMKQAIVVITRGVPGLDRLKAMIDGLPVEKLPRVVSRFENLVD